MGVKTLSLIAGYQTNAQMLESRILRKIFRPEKYNIIYQFITQA